MKTVMKGKLALSLVLVLMVGKVGASGFNMLFAKMSSEEPRPVVNKAEHEGNGENGQGYVVGVDKRSGRETKEEKSMVYLGNRQNTQQNIDTIPKRGLLIKRVVNKIKDSIENNVCHENYRPKNIISNIIQRLKQDMVNSGRSMDWSDSMNGNFDKSEERIKELANKHIHHRRRRRRIVPDAVRNKPIRTAYDVSDKALKKNKFNLYL